MITSAALATCMCSIMSRTKEAPSNTTSLRYATNVLLLTLRDHKAYTTKLSSMIDCSNYASIFPSSCNVEGQGHCHARTLVRVHWSLNLVVKVFYFVAEQDCDDLLCCCFNPLYSACGGEQAHCS